MMAMVQQMVPLRLNTRDPHRLDAPLTHSQDFRWIALVSTPIFPTTWNSPKSIPPPLACQRKSIRTPNNTKKVTPWMSTTILPHRHNNLQSLMFHRRTWGCIPTCRRRIPLPIRYSHPLPMSPSTMFLGRWHSVYPCPSNSFTHLFIHLFLPLTTTTTPRQQHTRTSLLPSSHFALRVEPCCIEYGPSTTPTPPHHHLIRHEHFTSSPPPSHPLHLPSICPASLFHHFRHAHPTSAPPSIKPRSSFLAFVIVHLFKSAVLASSSP